MENQTYYAIYDIYQKEYYYTDSYGKNFGSIEYADLFINSQEAIGETRMLGNNIESYEIHEVILQVVRKYKIKPILIENE
jgi:hypothetical protein